MPISVTPASVLEGATTSARTFTATRNGEGTTAQTYTVTLTPGTATTPADFTTATNAVFAAGSTTTTFTVTIVGDTVFEADEVFTVRFAGLNGPFTDTVTITNDDIAPTIQIAATPSAIGAEGDVASGNTANFTVTQSAVSGTLTTVNYTISGAGVTGSDFVSGSLTGTTTIAAGATTATISLAYAPDYVIEASEAYTVTITSANANATLGALTSANGTITNDDVASVYSISSPVVSESAGTAVVTVTRVGTGTTTAGNATVGYTVTDGTALSTAATATTTNDYTAVAPGTLTFAPGVLSQSFNVAITNDTVYELTQALNVSINSPTNGGTIGTGTGTVTINDNDTAPVLTLSALSQAEGTGAAGTFQPFLVPLVRAGATEVATVLTVTTTDGTAISTGTPATGQDFIARGASVTLPADVTGSTTFSLGVSVYTDAVIEPNETFGVTISGVTGATIAGGGATASVTNTIQNDDLPGVFSIANATANEGAGTVTVVVSRTGGLAEGIQVSYSTTGGTAQTNIDFTATSGTLTFAAGVASQSFTVPIVNDALFENTETFTATLGTPTQGGTIGTGTATITIVDNDTRSTDSGTTPPPTTAPPATTPPANAPVTSGSTTFASASYTQPADSTSTTISTQNNSGTEAINLTGNAGTQTIIGNYGGNVLNGGTAGADTLIGLLGNDTYVVTNASMVVIENGGEGIDTVQVVVADTVASEKVDAINTPGVTYALQADASVEFLAIQNANSTTAVNLTGSIFDQTITGNNGANIINGFGGNDTMIGLGGNDQYLVRGPGDVVIEANGGGTDTVFTTVSYSLGVNEVEVLSTVTNSDTTNIDLIGNFATQTIVGNYGNNVLNGGSGGLDVLIGLRGDDVYAVGDSRVDVIENAGEGNDTVVTSVDYALDPGMSIEVLAVQNRAGTTAINLFGNELAQTIAGNEGVNYIDGGLGNDTLIGGGGVDTFAFTTALGAGNVDVIADFQLGTDRIGLFSTVFNVGSGGVTASNFVNGTAALDGDDRILFNQATGQLFYDADGNGAGAAVLFALITPGVALTSSSFDVLIPAPIG